MTTQTSTTTVTQRSKTVTAATPAIAKTDYPAQKFLPSKNGVPKTFFLLDIVGLSAPKIALPSLLLLLCHYRQIPFWDLFFSIAFPLYVSLANRFRFDNNAREIALWKEGGEVGPKILGWFSGISEKKWFAKYMVFAASLGVLLPLLLQVTAPLPIAGAAAPHLYMLLFQIMMEKMANSPKFHSMLWLTIPLGYSAYRMACLKTWTTMAWQMVSSTNGHGSGAFLTWEMAHFLLALGNTIFWTYNLFVTLVLRVVPQCLDEHKFPDANVSGKYELVPLVASSGTTQVKN